MTEPYSTESRVSMDADHLATHAQGWAKVQRLKALDMSRRFKPIGPADFGDQQKAARIIVAAIVITAILVLLSFARIRKVEKLSRREALRQAESLREYPDGQK